jgi:hypothetical protein
MPNHITNIFDVTGTPAKVKAFKDKVYRVEKAKEDHWNCKKGDDVPIFDFDATVPMPKELEGTTSPSRTPNPELIKKYGADNWYDWCVDIGWGTKWGAYDAEAVQTTEGGLRFSFNTAWCAPWKWILTTSKMFPTLTFTDQWKNEGGGCGKLVVKKGHVISDEKLPDHDWYMKFDPAYRDEYEFITKGDYDKVVKTYSKEGESNYSSLNEYLLARIKQKDLPLFMHYEWYGLQDKFNRKLKS